jgi:hypothetical protein
MQQVADHMNLKPCADTQFSQVNSTALVLTVNIHTTDENQSLCSITSAQIQSVYARSSICMLCTCGNLSLTTLSLTNWHSWRMPLTNWPLRALRDHRKCTSSTRRRLYINEIEQATLISVQPMVSPCQIVEKPPPPPSQQNQERLNVMEVRRKGMKGRIQIGVTIY